MGVQTTADEKIDYACEHVQAALDGLQDIVVGQCWGHDDYTEEFQSNLFDAFHALLNVRVKLTR